MFHTFLLILVEHAGNMIQSMNVTHQTILNNVRVMTGTVIICEEKVITVSSTGNGEHESAELQQRTVKR